MHNRLFLAALALFFSFPAVAQLPGDSLISQISYFASVHSGGLFGKKGNGTSLSVFAVHGVRYKWVGLGVGIGYDAYEAWRTLPVFASVNFDLVTGHRSAFYLQMNTGYAKAWNPFADTDQFIYKDPGGFFHHPLVGYRIHRGRMRIYLSAGYKFQHLTYEETPRWWIWGYPSSKVTIDRDIERLSLHIGIGL